MATKFFSSSELPKLPKEVGPHPMDDVIHSLRHMVAEYCVTRQQMDKCETFNPLRIVCVQEALKTLGKTFNAIAYQYQGTNPQLAGVIYEKSNRYYDLANEA